MNRNNALQSPLKLMYRIGMNCRRLLPPQKCYAFGDSKSNVHPKVDRIIVINLDRQPARWNEMEKELRRVLDSAGSNLWSLAERYAAFDAKNLTKEPIKDIDIDPYYTLGEQLFVEPQPLTLPTRLELSSPIRMSRPEVAVARSHIDTWRKVAASNYDYVLVLEDDVFFRSGFAKHLDQAWEELDKQCENIRYFDILYLSYEEVKHGAPKTFISNNVFCPVRGLWHLSGYVISREGAEKLLRLLPCRGPVDLWINHQFGVLDVRATKRSIISQRRDYNSTNSYSILPALTKIGAITSERASLFLVRPSEQPVFAVGPEGSGLSSLAMALSMLGYRCCSDLHSLPSAELDMLLSGDDNRVFDAYVNIGALVDEAQSIRARYPQAKFIITTNTAIITKGNESELLEELRGADIAILHIGASNKWAVICEHLRCAPPACSFPELADIGQRRLICQTFEVDAALSCETPKRDKSPWVVESRQWWQGINAIPREEVTQIVTNPVRVSDCLASLNIKRWILRDDTFTDNLALFRPANIEFYSGHGAALSIKKEPLGVREYSAASITSRDQYLYGRFEAIIKASNAPGVITGFFLHRISPRQEIDIEIAGNRPDRLLVNVFYNPGGEGAKYDYGYRGAPSYIDLGFDASESYHYFAIEWGPSEIRWFVDNRLVHRRAEWQPTPIPHLPMDLHVNIWPSRSTKLAGRLVSRTLPTTTYIRSILLSANRYRRPLSL